tara:strand:+ start:341 stop:484 length:144 start_codon:yes stop_codon:yes gene_type:complete
MIKREDIEKRLAEIPSLLERLKAEYNQLLGYQQSILDSEKEGESDES